MSTPYLSDTQQVNNTSGDMGAVPERVSIEDHTH